MDVERISDTEQLQRLQSDWNLLAKGIPFRQWQWMRTWWDYYGQGRELCILHVRDHDGQTVGIAPWFFNKQVTGGVALRFLGTGRRECGSYLSLLCKDGRSHQVGEAISHWLMQSNGDGIAWDYLRLTGVVADDPNLNHLAENLTAHGVTFVSRPLNRSWRIALPSTWNQYLAALPRRYRRKLRRLSETYFDTGRATFEHSASSDQLGKHYAELAELSQRRRRSLGQKGSFAHAPFYNFLQQAAYDFGESGSLFLGRLLIDGQPAAATLGMVAEHVLYVYQCGMSPELAAHRPGWLLNMAAIRHAIDSGLKGADFLCGDEPYKRQLGAEPTQLLETCLVAPRWVSRLRHGHWATGQTVKHWAKSALNDFRGRAT